MVLSRYEAYVIGIKTGKLYENKKKHGSYQRFGLIDNIKLLMKKSILFSCKENGQEKGSKERHTATIRTRQRGRWRQKRLRDKEYEMRAERCISTKFCQF